MHLLSMHCKDAELADVILLALKQLSWGYERAAEVVNDIMATGG